MNRMRRENQKRKLEGYEAERIQERKKLLIMRESLAPGSERTQKEVRRRLLGVQKYTQFHDSAGRSCEIAYNLVPKGRKVCAAVRFRGKLWRDGV